MTMAVWQRRGILVSVGVLLLAYGWLRVQLVVYDRRVRAVEASLQHLRPAVLDAVEAQEQQATVTAHQQFAAAVKLAAIDWEGFFQQLAAALPPSIVLRTIEVDGSRLTLRGLLRYPPPEPQAYLTTVAEALKRHGVLRDVVVSVTPPAPDDPSAAGVELVGQFR